jgi:hypothetical protein
VPLKRPGAKIYKTADKTGAVHSILPEQMMNVTVDYSTPGLKDGEIYWYISMFQGDYTDASTFHQGYLWDGDIAWESPDESDISPPEDLPRNGQ